MATSLHRITSITGESSAINRLKSMGVLENITVTILKNTPKSPLLLKIANRRIAIQCGKAVAITTEPL